MVKTKKKTYYSDLIKFLREAKLITDLPKRRLWVLAIITEALRERNSKPVLIGGGAVEYYTFGGYTTQDMDLAISDHKMLSRVLKRLKFRQDGRYWYRDDLGILLEAPAGNLRAQGETAPLTEVKIRKMVCYIIGIEDLIIDRLNGFVHWQHKDDYRWAKEIASNHKDILDWKYLRRRGKAEKILPAISKLKKELGNVSKKSS